MATTMNYLEALARDALALEWGTEQQIETLNTFWHGCEERYPALFNENSAFSKWALKATDAEAVTEALRLMAREGA